MAQQIKTRTGTRATWTSTNPTLSAGELATESDTGQLKIGDGTTAWNSIAYAGTTGPAQTTPRRSLGDGSDGNVTVSAGTTTLTRDMYYNNLTLSGTGIIAVSGFKVFVKGILDTTSAAVGAIQANGASGGNASGATGGTVTTPPTAGSIGTSTIGTAGANGGTGVGAQSTALTGITGNGGSSNNAGAGGTSGTNAGGAFRPGSAPTTSLLTRWSLVLLRGATLLTGGGQGAGGGAGGGDGANSGGGGGGGGNGGGVVALYANIILKGSSTPAGVIQALGGAGGNGGTPGAGVCGGGGGGAAGGGGWVYLAYNFLAGPVVTNFIQAGGGTGGSGGNGLGAGALGGTGGNGGYGGRVNLICIPAATSTALAYPAASSVQAPETTTGNTAISLVGGGGLPGTVLNVSL